MAMVITVRWPRGQSSGSAAWIREPDGTWRLRSSGLRSTASIDLEVRASDSVYSVKEKLRDADVQLERCSLFFNDEILEDGWMLADHEIQDGDVLRAKISSGRRTSGES